MEFKNILIRLFIVFIGTTNLFSMEFIGQSLSFDIQCGEYSVRFRAVDEKDLYYPPDESTQYILDQSSKISDYQKFVAFCGDYEMLKSAFGWKVAVAIKGIYMVSPQAVVNEYIREANKKFEKMPSDKKIVCYWVIENNDRDKKGDFVGLFMLSTYIDDRSQHYKNMHLLEIGLCLTEPYRRKKVTSLCAMSVLKKLKTFERFNKAIFCFTARPDNTPVNRIAEKFSATIDCTSEMPIELGAITYTIPYNLFIIETE